MGSIFDVSYSENLRRVRGVKNTEGGITKTGTTIGELKNFNLLLAESQKLQEFSVSSKSTITAQAEQKDNQKYISNFSSTEEARGKEFISEKLSKLNFSLRELIQSKDTDSKSIQSVKDLAYTETVNGIRGKLKTPQLMTVEKAEQGKLGPAIHTFNEQEIKNIITTAGRFHGIDPLLGLAVAQAESSLKHDAVSADGHHSKGVFQLLDSTAHEMMDRLGVEEDYNPFDPGMNAYLGAGYLKHLYNAFSVETILKENLKTHPAKNSNELEKLAVASFNAGEGTVARAQEKAKALGKDPGQYNSIESYLPKETRRYVNRVQQLRYS